MKVIHFATTIVEPLSSSSAASPSFPWQYKSCVIAAVTTRASQNTDDDADSYAHNEIIVQTARSIMHQPDQCQRLRHHHHHCHHHRHHKNSARNIKLSQTNAAQSWLFFGPHCPRAQSPKLSSVAAPSPRSPGPGTRQAAKVSGAVGLRALRCRVFRFR